MEEKFGGTWEAGVEHLKAFIGPNEKDAVIENGEPYYISSSFQYPTHIGLCKKG